MFGLRLIRDDEGLQAAIRLELERARTPAIEAGGGHARRSRDGLNELEAQHRKLLHLFYEDRIGADLFAEEEVRLTKTIAAARSEIVVALQEVEMADDR